MSKLETRRHTQGTHRNFRLNRHLRFLRGCEVASCQIGRSIILESIGDFCDQPLTAVEIQARVTAVLLAGRVLLRSCTAGDHCHLCPDATYGYVPQELLDSIGGDILTLSSKDERMSWTAGKMDVTRTRKNKSHGKGDRTPPRLCKLVQRVFVAWWMTKFPRKTSKASVDSDIVAGTLREVVFEPFEVA